MMQRSKTLADRLYLFKKVLYLPLAAAVLTLGSYSSSKLYSQTPRANETKNFESDNKDKKQLNQGLEKILSFI